jgi:hypothetical protein
MGDDFRMLVVGDKLIAAARREPPHVIGDANPKGGFYTSNFNGGCRLMSMKEAMDRGLISINATPKR